MATLLERWEEAEEHLETALAFAKESGMAKVQRDAERLLEA